MDYKGICVELLYYLVKMKRVFILLYIAYLSSLSLVNGGKRAKSVCERFNPYRSNTNTVTTIHVACAFCKQHNLTCKTSVCGLIRQIVPQKTVVLANALCHLCKHYKFDCRHTFCTDNIAGIMDIETKINSNLCLMCEANGTSCRNAPMIDWMNILDGPIWDRALTDDMFTSMLIGDVERGKWDGFLQNIMPQFYDEYYFYYGEYSYDDYEDDFYDDRDSYDDD